MRDIDGEGREHAGEAGRLVALGDHRLQGLEQRVVTEVGAVFDVEFEAADGAQTHHRRRRNREHKRVLDPRKTLVQRPRNGRAAQVPRSALLKRLEAEKDDARVGSDAETTDAQAGKSNRVLDTRLFQTDLRHAADHRFRAIERGSVGKLREGDEILLVLGRNETGRHFAETPAGEENESAIDQQRDGAFANHAAHAGGVFVAGPGEKPVERPEQPADQFLHQPREPVLRRVMILEQRGAQGRRKRQRIERGDHRRDGNGDGELFVKLTGEAADKCRGHKHGAQHQRRGDNRPGDLVHRAFGGVEGRQSEGDIALDVFDNHDGVVHHDADGQHQTEQRQRVDAEAEGEHHGKRSDEGHGHGGEWNDGSAPGLEKNDDHNDNQQDGLKECVDHRFNGMAHEDSRVIHHRVIDTVGEIFLQVGHCLADVLGKLEGVRARRLKDRKRHGGFVVQQRAQRIAGCAQFEAGNVLEQRFFPIGSGLDDDLAELLGGNQAALGVDLEFEIDGPADRLLADRPGGDLHVLFPDGVDHVSGREVSGGDLVGIEPDAHSVIARAEHLDITGAGDARQNVLDLQGGEVAEINFVVATVGREQVDHQREVGRLLDGRHTEPADFLGQFGKRLRNPVLHLHLGLVDVRAELERDRQRHHPIPGGLRKHVE